MITLKTVCKCQLSLQTYRHRSVNIYVHECHFISWHVTCLIRLILGRVQVNLPSRVPLIEESEWALQWSMLEREDREVPLFKFPLKMLPLGFRKPSWSFLSCVVWYENVTKTRTPCIIIILSRIPFIKHIHCRMSWSQWTVPLKSKFL